MVARMVAAAAAVACLAFLGLGSLPPVRAAIKSSFLIAPPFDKHDHRGSRIIPYWDKSGATNIMQSFVRMTPDKPEQYGTLWTRSSVGTPDFSIEWKFRISGSEKSSYGDSLALIISDTKYKAGRFFGFTEVFEGLAVVINTNRNLISYNKPGEPSGRHRDVTIVANNGTRNLDNLLAGLEGCNANVRFDETRDDFNVMQATRIRLKSSGNTVALEVDARNSGRWRRCATIAHVDMPKDWATKCTIGMLARTGELTTNNHDMLGFRLYTDPQEAWEVDSYGDDDEDDLDTLVHHMEHELFNVHDSLQDTIDQLQQAEEDAERRLAELEASLNQNVMSALEDRVAKLEVQVQTSVSRTLNKHVNQVYGRLEEDVGDKLSAKVGQISASWRWPFICLLLLVLAMVLVSFTKYRELKKQHLL